MAKQLNWMVRLGVAEWTRHTYERKDSSLILLGSVKRGPQMGALGMTDTGQYVQVVGDYLVPLNRSQIERALVKARAFEAHSQKRTLVRTIPPPAPVVIVKRRRIALPA